MNHNDWIPFKPMFIPRFDKSILLSIFHKQILITDAVVKQRIILSTSGTPSCNIEKDVLKLEMDHFSWLYITFTWVKNVFLGRKKMCCRPFIEKELDWQKTGVILHARLYDDIKGNSEVLLLQQFIWKFMNVTQCTECLAVWHHPVYKLLRTLRYL